MKNEWSGDIDWGDRDLQRRHGDYIKYLQFVDGIGGKQRRAYAYITADLEKQLQNVVEENEFLVAGHAKAREECKSKRKLLNVSEESLFPLAWDVKGYSKFIEKNAAIKESITNYSKDGWSSRCEGQYPS